MNISDTKFRKPVFPGDEVYAYVTALDHVAGYGNLMVLQKI
jgi:acyl dehydratase